MARGKGAANGMVEFSPFNFFRFMLTIVVTVYCAIRLLMWLPLVMQLTAGNDRGARLLRRYLLVQALRIRFRRFAWEMVQIVLLFAILCLLIARHWL